MEEYIGKLEKNINTKFQEANRKMGEKIINILLNFQKCKQEGDERRKV